VGLFLDYTIKLTSSNQLLIFTSLTPSSHFIIVVNLEKGTIQNKIQLTCPGNITLNCVTNKAYVSFAYAICEIDGVNLSSIRHGRITSQLN
jgi:hypothetical protein